MNDSSIQLILTVKIYLAPENVESFFSHLQPAFDAVMQEPECRYFVIGEDVQNPGVITWTEGWTESVEWFMTVSDATAVGEGDGSMRSMCRVTEFQWTRQGTSHWLLRWIVPEC